MEKSYQSAFKPVQTVVDKSPVEKKEDSDDEVDIETTDDKTTTWDLKEEKVR